MNVVCMSVCMCLCVCMYQRVFVFLDVCMHEYMHVCADVYTDWSLPQKNLGNYGISRCHPIFVATPYMLKCHICLIIFRSLFFFGSFPCSFMPFPLSDFFVSTLVFCLFICCSQFCPLQSIFVYVHNVCVTWATLCSSVVCFCLYETWLIHV